MNRERAEPAVAGHRPIRSFVLRQGRTTPAQQRAFEQHWLRYGLDYAGTPRDWNVVFDRDAARVLEIGFGNGEALLAAAQNDGQRDYLGIEVHRPGVGRLLNALAAAHIDNVRLYHHDAVEVLHHELDERSLDEIRIWFPDPWHKKRHHKRRLIQSDFVDLLCSRLRPGGLLHLATDWSDYAEHMFDVLEACTDLRNRLGARTPAARPPWRIETHFEARGQRLGHGVWDLLYDRR